MMAYTRKDILDAAEKCVNGERDHSYGSPENNFETIAQFWNAYLIGRGREHSNFLIDGKDVAAMLALMKLARISSGQGKADNWIDLAGYAACGGEIETINKAEIDEIANEKTEDGSIIHAHC